jgi:transcriptional regulator with XRE-family HTH domain
MTFNEKLLSLRKKAGLSQEDLAEKLDVSRQAVSRWETGETLPDAKNLLELSSIFETSIDYLLRDEMDFPSITSKPVQIPKAPPKNLPFCMRFCAVSPFFWYA